MAYASTSAIFGEPASGTALAKNRSTFRGRKRTARFRSGNSASYQHRSPVKTLHETHRMEAFQEMVSASRPKFLAIAHAVLRNREDAEDAVQDALLSGYLHLPSFEGRSALKTWFTRIVLNAALMIRRKRKSAWMIHGPETTSDDTRWMQKIPSSQPGPEMVYAEREAFQFINEALGKMKPVLRQALTMTYYDEMSGPEARAVLGASTAAFKSRLLRARRQLLNEARRSGVVAIRRATPSFPDKDPFQHLAAAQPDKGLLEVSSS